MAKRKTPPRTHIDSYRHKPRISDIPLGDTPKAKNESPRSSPETPKTGSYIGRVLHGTLPLVDVIRKRANSAELLTESSELVLPLTPVTMLLGVEATTANEAMRRATEDMPSLEQHFVVPTYNSWSTTDNSGAHLIRLALGETLEYGEAMFRSERGVSTTHCGAILNDKAGIYRIDIARTRSPDIATEVAELTRMLTFSAVTLGAAQICTIPAN